MEKVARDSKEAYRKFYSHGLKEKNELLGQIKKGLAESHDLLLQANQRDIESAQKMPELNEALIKRLDLFGKQGEKWTSLLQGVHDIIEMEDPINKRQLFRQLDTDLVLERRSCPIGTILIIFEARPEVIVQITSLCIKSGNSVILKGGREAANTNNLLVSIIRKALGKELENFVQYVGDREAVKELLGLHSFIDLVIPRGSNQLVQYVKLNTCIPVLGHADGICSIFVDAKADPAKAIKIIIDSKTNYPAACNAVEMILIHRDAIDSCLRGLVKGLRENGVVVNLESGLLQHDYLQDPGVREMIRPDHFFQEFLRKEITIMSVSSMQEAINLIHQHGSSHTEGIITEDEAAANAFLDLVDSAGVYWNASTRFADGYRYGFGAEIGVSTNRIHARGPVGMEGLTIYKYVLKGDGHTVGEYQNGTRSFKHKDLM